MADEGDEIALASSFDAQNAEAVLGVVERDAIDEAGEPQLRCLFLAPRASRYNED
jgi:hypothetical protein